MAVDTHEGWIRDQGGFESIRRASGSPGCSREHGAIGLPRKRFGAFEAIFPRIGLETDRLNSPLVRLELMLCAVSAEPRDEGAT